jgi:hypothetical protein
MPTYKSGLGSVMDATLSALQQARPQALNIIIDKHDQRFVQDLARASKMLGLLLVARHDDMDDLVELGWLQIALSEMCLSWLRFSLPNPDQRTASGD